MAKEADYYDRIYAHPYPTGRYNLIYKQVGEWLSPDDEVLDLGCGQADIVKFLPTTNYIGLDFSAQAIAKAKKHGIGHAFVVDIRNLQGFQADVILCTEVLEHIDDDVDLLRKISPGTRVIFSVPSFEDPAHVRLYDEPLMRLLYQKLLDIKTVVRFNMRKGMWDSEAPPTRGYILLVDSERLPNNLP